MGKKRLLKLVWIGSDGEPYFEQEVSPRIARDLIIRRREHFDLLFDYQKLPLHHLTYAAVSRARRCVEVRFQPSGKQLLVDAVE